MWKLQEDGFDFLSKMYYKQYDLYKSLETN